MNLLNQVAVDHVNDAIAAASNTDDDSAVIDMQGYQGVIFMVPITDSVATGVATLTVEQDTASNGSFAALSGAQAQAICATNDDLNGKLLMVDVFRPRERYVRANVTSSTANIAFGDTIAIRYGAMKMPVSAGDVADLAVVVGPSEV